MDVLKNIPKQTEKVEAILQAEKQGKKLEETKPKEAEQAASAPSKEEDKKSTKTEQKEKVPNREEDKKVTNSVPPSPADAKKSSSTYTGVTLTPKVEGRRLSFASKPPRALVIGVFYFQRKNIFRFVAGNLQEKQLLLIC